MGLTPEGVKTELRPPVVLDHGEFSVRDAMRVLCLAGDSR